MFPLRCVSFFTVSGLVATVGACVAWSTDTVFAILFSSSVIVSGCTLIMQSGPVVRRCSLSYDRLLKRLRLIPEQPLREPVEKLYWPAMNDGD